jgi:hypothetical protein
VQRRALGVLFVILASAFALIALASVRAGQWVIAAPTVVLCAWLGSLALKALGLR